MNTSTVTISLCAVLLAHTAFATLQTKSNNNFEQPNAIVTTKQFTDAPKLYHLNELLYKSTSAHDSPQAAALPSLQKGFMMSAQDSKENDLRPLHGGSASMQPRGLGRGVGMNARANEDADDDDSIESLLKAMRGRGNTENAASPGAMSHRRSEKRPELGSEDEATIQRKSTMVTDDESDSVQPSSNSSRLRSRGK